MSAFQRLAPAALAAAVAVAVAACGATSGSTTTSTQATSGGPASPSNGSSAGASSAFPYAPGGVTYTGEGGAVYTFSIPAGTYSENQQASYDPANDPSGSGECLYAGELDYLSGSGWSAPLGGSAPITAMSGINGPAVEATFGAGDYRLYIYPETTCSWTFELSS